MSGEQNEDHNEERTEDPIRIELDVPLAQAAAFRFFTEGMHRWWPREYTWSQGVLQWIGLEPREGGRCTERGPHGFQCDWGRVLAWSPPSRLSLSWQISPRREPVPDPARASEIEVGFTPMGTGTSRLVFEHRAFERHGEGSEGYREALAGPMGWPFLLERFIEEARREAGAA